MALSVYVHLGTAHRKMFLHYDWTTYLSIIFKVGQ